jgi:hypothetical protein
MQGLCDSIWHSELLEMKKFLCSHLVFLFAGRRKCSELGFDLFGQMLSEGERFANEYPRRLVVRELVEVSILLYMGYTQHRPF